MKSSWLGNSFSALRLYWLILILTLVLLPSSGFAGTKVIDYGFEDWTGDANTTPGYLFNISDAGLWADQLSATEVLSSCNGRTARSGTYFFRYRMDENYDSCLGTTPASENVYVRFGDAQTYPVGSGDKTDFSSVITSDIMTLRFWVRFTGNWPPTGVTANPYSKFVRTIVGTSAYEDDDSSLFFNLSSDADQIRILDYGNSEISYTSISDLNDGQWHSFSIVYTRLNDTNTNPNYTTEFWIDDWDMTGNRDGSVTVYAPDGGSAFQLIALWVNYGGTAKPTNEHAIELDDIEVWDGLPESGIVTIMPPHLDEPVTIR